MKRPKRHPESADGWAEERLQEIRAMTLGERLGLTLKMTNDQFAAWREEIVRLYPQASEQEVRGRLASKHLPPELVVKAFGWDPAKNTQVEH